MGMACVLGAVALLLGLLAAGRCGRVWEGWVEVLGVVSGEWRVEMVEWWAYLSIGFSCTLNNDNSIIIIILAILYSGGHVGMGSRDLRGGLW